MNKWSILAVLGLVACGVPNGKKLSELDSDDAAKLCEEYDEPVTAECEVEGSPKPIEVTVGGEECDAEGVTSIPDSCEATVGDWRDCMDALSDDPCAIMSGIPEECTTFMECFSTEA